MRQALLLFMMLTGLISCSTKIKVVNEIATIDVYETPEENEELGRGLISFNYADEVKENFPMVDLEGITYQCFRQSANDEVKFRLILTNTAVAYSSGLTSLFETIIKKKMDELRERKNTFKEAVLCSERYFEFIANNNLDSLWHFASIEMKATITKDEFNKVLVQRDTSFHPRGARKVNSRQYHNSLRMGSGILKDDFYVINYSYSDGGDEQIILQGDSLKLAGYKFYLLSK